MIAGAIMPTGLISKKIGVLIIDDSIFMRKIIIDILSQDPEINILGEAKNG